MQKSIIFTTLLLIQSAIAGGIKLSSSGGALQLNGEPQDYFARKVKIQNNQEIVFTFRHGLKIMDGEVTYAVPLPKSPVFHWPRQVENAYPTRDGLWVITRNKLLWADKYHFKYQNTKGVRGGTRFSAVLEHDEGIYLGSTFNGVYFKSKGSDSYLRLSSGLPREKYSWGEYFYDEIKELFTLNGSVYALTDYTKSIYRLVGKQWQKMDVTEVIDIPLLTDRNIHIGKADGGVYFWGGQATALKKLNVSKDNYLVVKGRKLTSWKPRKKEYPYKKNFPKARGDLVSLFINLDFITFEGMDQVVNMLKQGRANALVINFKDDTGNLIYGSKIPEAIDAKASMLHPKFKRFFSKIREYDPYIIARLTVFKDFRMHKYQNYKYALKHKDTGEPWRVHKKEYWVDPFSSFHVNYMLKIVKELQSRRQEWGLDELQFDYIRFPSDPQLKQVKFSHRKKDWEKYDILENFLSKVNQIIEIPYSLDIYGYNGIYRMGNVIGQDVETISKYAPIICPMYYPSHFGPTYLSKHPKGQAYAVMEFGTRRAKALAYEGTHIRPYLQAFSYRVKNYNHLYIENQIEGAKAAKTDGYGFWHPGSKYKTLENFLIKISIDRD